MEGSHAFAAPEILLGSDEVHGERQDLWSMGCTLYLLATGKVPFHGSSLYSLFSAITAGKVQVPSRLSPALRQLVRGLLTPRAAQRWTLNDVRRCAWMRGHYNLSSPPLLPLPLATQEATSRTIYGDRRMLQGSDILDTRQLTYHQH
ncbi:MAG: hypothetical protein MHM6MM_007742 [Cercozoa sp. M6MM]